MASSTDEPRPPKTREAVARMVELVAQKQGWVLNPDPKFVGKIVEGLQTNYNRYGYFLCPCRDGDGDREMDRDIVCPCKYNLPDQAEFGHCFCGLYLAKAFAASGQAITAIPERRVED